MGTRVEKISKRVVKSEIGDASAACTWGADGVESFIGGPCGCSETPVAAPELLLPMERIVGWLALTLVNPS